MKDAEFICDMIAPRGDQENLKPRGLFAHSSAGYKQVSKSCCIRFYQKLSYQTTTVAIELLHLLHHSTVSS